MAYYFQSLLTIPNPAYFVQRALRKGISVPRNLLKVSLAGNRQDSAALVSISLGRGAGYKNGRTLFFAKNCLSRTGKKFAFTYGYCDDWNKLPWVAS